MKKIIVLVSCLVLVFSLAVLPVSAAADGYDFLSTASEFFVNGSIVGEGVVLITNNDSLANANLKWAISVMLAPTETEGVYTVVFVHTGDGNTPAITLEEGQILLGVHSSTSNTDQASEYPNVYGKLAATALEIGEVVTITGIDIEAGTVADDASIIAGGTVSEESDVYVPDGNVSEEPETESAPEADESTPADTSAPADVSDNSVADAPAGGNNTWIYIACGVAAVIIVAVVVVMVKKK
jgi:hypothetical protein